jgi:hypothetical protein
MAEATTPPPGNIGQTFDLETRDAGASGHGITLADATLSWTVGDQQRQRAFDDISTIDLDTRLGGHFPTATCDILFTDGVRLTVRMKNDMPNEIMIYRSFVLAFFQQLGAAHRARIIFREGYPPERQMRHVVSSAVGLVVALAALVFAISSNQLHQEDNGWIAVPLILLFVALLCGVLWKSVNAGQKPFDPEAIPNRALPPAPRQRPVAGLRAAP